MSKSIVKQMNKAEIKKSLKTMSKGVIAIREGLTFMKLGKAHEAYGYGSFKDFLVKKVALEIDYSYDSCNDQANAGVIEYNVGGIEFIGINSYSALEPLIRAKLDPAEQKEVFQHIAEEDDFGHVKSIPKKHITKRLMEKTLAKLCYVDDENSTDDASEDEEPSKGEDNGSTNDFEESLYADEVISSMHTNLKAWVQNQNRDEVDQDEIYGFFETVDEMLIESESVFEQVVIKSIDVFFNESEKLELCKIVLTSISKSTAKNLIKSIY
jgi:hypothetical protein